MLRFVRSETSAPFFQVKLILDSARTTATSPLPRTSSIVLS